jgi:penicillin-binding protein 2
MVLVEIKNSRALTWLAGLVVVLSLVTVRLVHLQVFQTELFAKQADANQEFRVILPPWRGMITDRYGEPLAYNETSYRQIQNPGQLFATSQVISRETALELIAGGKEDEVVEQFRRRYRFGMTLAHLVGYVGLVTAEELELAPHTLRDQLVGKTGLERAEQDRLQGQPGSISYQVDALGKKRDVLSRQPPSAGEVLQTTLDPWLSEKLRRSFGTRRGAIVLMDGEKGDVLSLISVPDFEPEVFQISREASNEAQRAASVSGYLNDPHLPLFARAIAGEYPPGSVFKPVTALAGLEAGVINQDTTVDDAGTLQVGAFQFGNWYFRQYGRTEGTLAVRRALARSNDIFFYKVAEWLTPERLAQYAELFGYNQPTGFDVPGERSGVVPSPAWKRQRFGQPWYLGNTYHFGIGQGDVLVTPLQVAQMTQVLANAGQRCTPRVLERSPIQCQQLAFRPENISTVIEGMIQACSAGGTAFPLFPHNTARTAGEGTVAEQLERGVVAGKTGTAEFGAEDDRGYHRTHGWFTMFVRVPDALTQASSSATASGTLVASGSAELTVASEASDSAVLTEAKEKPIQELDDATLRAVWRSHTQTVPLPRTLVLTVFVESDEQEPYKEGSRDASPIAADLMKWIYQ